MNALQKRDAAVPTVASLHPDWRKAWGRTIEGADLRAALEANPRLQSRILGAIGKAHGRTLRSDPRLDETSLRVAKALGADRDGFVRLCGLAHIGRRIAMATNPDDYTVLSRAFGGERLAAAVRIAAALPGGAGEHGYDSEQLVPAVERTGRAVLASWVATLPAEAADWMTMLLPPSEEGGLVATARAVAIVEGAADHWTPPAEGSEARTERTSRRRRAA